MKNKAGTSFFATSVILLMACSYIKQKYVLPARNTN